MSSATARKEMTCDFSFVVAGGWFFAPAQYSAPRLRQTGASFAVSLGARGKRDNRYLNLAGSLNEPKAQLSKLAACGGASQSGFALCCGSWSSLLASGRGPQPCTGAPAICTTTHEIYSHLQSSVGWDLEKAKTSFPDSHFAISLSGAGPHVRAVN